jgi:hypothetical protein
VSEVCLQQPKSGCSEGKTILSKGAGGRSTFMGECNICGVEIQPVQQSALQWTIPGVFPALVNRAAFLDKLVLGIDGTPLTRVPQIINKTTNSTIGGPGRPYARSLRGTHTPSGNPFELKYGRNPRYRNLYDTKLILRSEAAPLFCAQAVEIIDSFFRVGKKVAVQEVEFTRDVSVPFKFFENHILTAVRSVRLLEDTHGWQTLYAGKPGARWMMRAYQKSPEITRVEFVFRRGFLAGAGINDLAGLQGLKDIACDRLVRFPAICRRALQELIAGKVPAKQSQVLLGLPDRWPTTILLDTLEYHGLPGKQILRPSPVEKLLADMQKSFTWITK